MYQGLWKRNLPYFYKFYKQKYNVWLNTFRYFIHHFLCESTLCLFYARCRVSVTLNSESGEIAPLFFFFFSFFLITTECIMAHWPSDRLSYCRLISSGNVNPARINYVNSDWYSVYVIAWNQIGELAKRRSGSENEMKSENSPKNRPQSVPSRKVLSRCCVITVPFALAK